MRLLALLALACASLAQAPFWDVVLIGPTSNLAAKYLWQSLFHLHCETRGALRVHAAGREAAPGVLARVTALIQANTTCGRHPSRACADARAAFAEGVRAHSTGAAGGLAELGDALARSAALPGHRGRLLYFAVASEVVPGVLRGLAAWVDLGGPGTRVVVEKPVGRSRASAGALLASLRAPDLPPPGGLLLMDHYLAKAGLLLAAGARWALAQHAPWRAALAAPAVTEAWAMEAEHCGGRAEYYNTAGAVRDMLVTHLTLAAAAALQPPGHSARVTPAARAGVLAALVPTSSLAAHSAAPARLRLGSYAGANASGHALRGAGAVTAAGGVLELRSGSGSGGGSSGRVVLWTGKALGLRGGGVRQVLRLGGGEGSTGAAAAAARAACGPLTVTYHLQGQLLPPSPALEALLQGLHRQLQRSASGGGGGASASGAPDYPVLVITGLCGATGVALGDPGALLAQLRRRAARGEGGGAQGWGEESGQWKWEVRSDAAAGVWMGMLVVPPASPEEAVARWQGGGGPPGSDSSDESGALEQRLLRLALRPALGGGEAYTSAIASALLGRTEAFLSVEETDRLWAVWDGMVAEADARGGSGSGLEEYAVGVPPAWMRAKEAGRTLGGVAVGSAGGAGGSEEEL